MGRVQRVQEPMGRWTLYGYSTGGRLVRTVQNASKPLFFTVAGAAADLSNYATVGGSLSTDTARDIITSTTYDAKGRVQTVTDTHGNVAYTVYDDLDRVVMTIQNYVVQGSSKPEDWLWDVNNNPQRWENGSGAAITFTSANDQNIITANAYDPLGRLISTRDSAGRVTRYCYDRAGRRTRTIVNYVAQGGTDPATWYWMETICTTAHPISWIRPAVLPGTTIRIS